jgi:hypothetical protein
VVAVAAGAIRQRGGATTDAPYTLIQPIAIILRYFFRTTLPQLIIIEVSRNAFHISSAPAGGAAAFFCSSVSFPKNHLLIYANILINWLLG